MNPKTDLRSIRKLPEQDMVTFDQDFISDGRFASITSCIDRDFPDGRFSFVDVGGGNGQFTDRLLAHYPNAHGHLVDNSELLVERNAANPRKTLHMISVEDMPKEFAGTTFDVAMFNFSLHHFVVRSYAQTRTLQRVALATNVALLAPNGRLSIVENLCDSYLGTFSGRFIHELTSNTKLAPLIKRLGSNAAGTGVCFLDGRSWRQEIERTGLQVLHFEPEDYPNILSDFKKRLLLMKDWRAGHYWAGRR